MRPSATEFGPVLQFLAPLSARVCVCPPPSFLPALLQPSLPSTVPQCKRLLPFPNRPVRLGTNPSGSLSLSLTLSAVGGGGREGRGGRRRDGVESGSGLTRTVCDARDSTMAADAPSHTPSSSSSSSPHCGNGNLRQHRAIIQSVWYYTQNMYNIDMRTK